MFLTAIEDLSDQKLVEFYSVFTTIYFGSVLVALYVTDSYFLLGSYQFTAVLGLIVFLESVKYIVGKRYYSKANQPIIGRSEGSSKKNHNKSSGKLKELFKCSVIMMTMLVMFYVIAILFGAQVFSKQEETFMLSLMLCVLTTFPACLNVGSQSVMYLAFGMKPNVDILGVSLLKSMQLTLLGCWLGAFVIPLDWDRPWQEWPISCGVGAMVGYLTASAYMLTLVYVLKYQQAPNKKSGRKGM